MDVRHAGADRVEQDFLDVLDDRRVLDVGIVLDRKRRRAILEADFHVLEVGHVLERRAARLDELGDGLPELVVLDDDGLGNEIGLEAHFLQRLQVGGIGNGAEQLVAALVKRQHAPRLRDLEVDVFLLDLVGIEAREVEQRRAEGARGEHRDLRRRHALAGQQLLDKGNTGGLRLRLQRFGLVLGHEAALRERTCETADVTGCGVRGHGALRAIPVGCRVSRQFMKASGMPCPKMRTDN